MRGGNLIRQPDGIAVWEERVDEPAFRRAVMEPLIRFLRGRGWKVGADPRIREHYPSLSPGSRRAAKGRLLMEISVCGRHMKFDLRVDRGFSGDAVHRLSYLERLRLRLELDRAQEHLAGAHGYTVKTKMERPSPDGVTALEWVEAENRASGHYRPELGRADWGGHRNRRSGDGVDLEHGQIVWLWDHSERRPLRGRAFYHLNNMWWVVLGRWRVENRCASDLYTSPPAISARWGKVRRQRLEQEIRRAVERLDFTRAAILKRLVFGDAPVFRVRSESGWWRPQSSGYTPDVLGAGLYLEHELPRGRDVRHVPVAAGGVG